jgi:hypothetical protein
MARLGTAGFTIQQDPGRADIVVRGAEATYIVECKRPSGAENRSLKALSQSRAPGEGMLWRTLLPRIARIVVRKTCPYESENLTGVQWEFADWDLSRFRHLHESVPRAAPAQATDSRSAPSHRATIIECTRHNAELSDAKDKSSGVSCPGLIAGRASWRIEARLKRFLQWTGNSTRRSSCFWSFLALDLTWALAIGVLTARRRILPLLRSRPAFPYSFFRPRFSTDFLPSR